MFTPSVVLHVFSDSLHFPFFPFVKNKRFFFLVTLKPASHSVIYDSWHAMFVFAFEHILYFIAGVLITGGESTGNTAELYLPSSATSCTLPGLPDSRRYHSADGDLLCGGSDTPAWDSCLQWSPDTGSWEAAVTLGMGREGHSSWTSTRGTYLMGGGYVPSTTLIKPDGTQEPGFPLKYDAA